MSQPSRAERGGVGSHADQQQLVAHAIFRPSFGWLFTTEPHRRRTSARTRRCASAGGQPTAASSRPTSRSPTSALCCLRSQPVASEPKETPHSPNVECLSSERNADFSLP